MDQIALAAGVLCWTTTAIVWIGGAVYGLGWNRADPANPAVSARVPVSVTLGFTAAAAALALGGPALLGSLRMESAWARLLGMVLLVASTAFALWARQALGTSWAVRPMVTGDRRLRTGGPYRITRHPIYTGLLGMLIGTSLLAGGGPALTLPAIGLVIIAAKIRTEEPLLLATFPDSYPAYRDAVPALVPGWRLWRRRPSG